MPIRALIVDDHRIVRQGMKMSLALDPEFKAVGEATKGEQALVVVENPSLDVVLMDLLMPVMDGIAVRQPRLCGTFSSCATTIEKQRRSLVAPLR